MNTLRTSFCVLLSIAGPALLFSSTSLAQNADDEVLEEIVVQGVRMSLADALESKRASDLVVETISSDSIGQLPDVTIAESLIRLPGINGARDRGNESQAVIRGMGPRLVLGLVNGREVASSEPGRNIRWEIYPSEIVSSVKVYKSQSADLVSGGVAGTIDLRTISPLDHSASSFQFRGGPTFYEAAEDIPDYDPWGYRGSLSWVGKISDEFGASLAVTTQQQQNGYPSFQGWGYNDDALGGSPGDVNGDGTLDYTPWGAQTEVKKLDQQRNGLVGAMQWRPSDRFELKFDAVYSEVEIQEDQDQTWFSRNGTWGNWDGGNNWAYLDYEFAGNDIVAANINWGSVTNVIAQYTEDKSVFATGLNAIWGGDAWEFSVDASFSDAQRDNTWQAVMTELYPEFSAFDMRAGVEPSVVLSEDTSDVNNQFAADWLAGVHDGPESIDDELSALNADFMRELGEDGLFRAFSVGLRVSDRDKAHRRNSWNQYTPAGGLQIPSNMLSSYSVSAFTVPNMLTGDFNQLAQMLYGGFSDPGNSEVLEDRWRVKEDVLEGYVKLDFATANMSGNFGVRFVDVDTASSGFESVAGGPLNWVTIDHSYSEALPSLNMNFFISDDYIVRAGVGRVMSRPPLDELRAFINRDDPDVTPPPLTAWGGNPKLNPFLAWQIDLSSEWYFEDEALFAVAVYYKDVDSHIGYSTVPIELDGETYLLSGPGNGDGGRISGVEFTFQTPFYFIPALENFGIYSNYAYVDSNIKEFYPWNNPLSASGIAKNTATVDLWYSSNKFEGRFGYKYHSEYSLIYGWTGSDVRTLESEGIFGLSMSYQINDQMGLRFQVNNLTDESLRIYRDNNPNRLGRYDEYGRSYLLDFTYGF